MEESKKELEGHEKRKVENAEKLKQTKQKLLDAEKFGAGDLQDLQKALKELEKEAEEIRKKDEEINKKEKVNKLLIYRVNDRYKSVK